MTASDSSRTALVRRPSSRLDEGIVTHIARQRVDYPLAYEQWERYVEALAKSGWEIVEVPSAEDCPDSVFVEDAMVAFRNVAVVTRPGADARKPEVHAVEKVVEGLGCSMARIVGPGTLDGGDVLKVGDTVYVGRGGRTNAEGIRQFRRIVEPLGATVVPVPIRSVLHLKSAVTALPDGTAVGFGPLVDHPSVFARYLEVPEASGAHVVVLGPEHVLMAADCPRTAELYADLGYEPTIVDISEYEKLEGCVTCLSVRLRGLPHVHVP